MSSAAEPEEMYAALQDPSYDDSQLESLPPALLAQLLRRAVLEKRRAEQLLAGAEAEKLGLQRSLAAAERAAQLAQWKLEYEQAQVAEHERRAAVERYILEPMLKSEPTRKYEHAVYVAAKWQPLPRGAEGGTDDIGWDLRWDKDAKGLCYFGKEERSSGTGSSSLPHKRRREDDPPFHRVISSAFLLYRLCCLFPVEMDCFGIHDEGSWETALAHKATGEPVTFGERKGAASVGVRMERGKELEGLFRQDLLELLNLLCAEDCPHGYGGLVAGSIM